MTELIILNNNYILHMKVSEDCVNICSPCIIIYSNYILIKKILEDAGGEVKSSFLKTCLFYCLVSHL